MRSTYATDFPSTTSDLRGPSTFQFGDCVIDRDAREVRLGGVPRAIAPKTFDVLLYLVDNRSRVVPKDELLDKIWSGVVVTENVVARTVMKARDAIGDPGANPSMIRTVHRIGYRFVAPLSSHDEAAPEHVDNPESRLDTRLDTRLETESAPVGLARTHLTLLPFLDLGTDAGFSWREFGMMSTTLRALETDERVSVTSIDAVMLALDSDIVRRAPAIDRVAAVGRATAADWSICVEFLRGEAGYDMRYVLVGMTGTVRTGRFASGSSAEVGAGLAAALRSELFARDDAPIAGDASRQAPLAAIAA